jgi:glucokinase
MSKVVIGIDLGGTRIKSVALDAEGHILEQSYAPTNDGDAAAWKKTVASIVQEWSHRTGNTKFLVGISAPGLPNEKNTAIAYMPGRLRGLENFEWSELFGCPAWVLNDAVGAMMAEARLGVARTMKNAVLITLGTGVGGAILIDGKPYQGSFQKAGHIGHISLDSEAEPDIVGMPGSLEDAIGNASLHKRSHGRFKDTHALLESLRKGDPFAREVWLKSVKKLAIGIACVTNVLSPESVILAGGISEAGTDLLDPLEEFLSVYEWRAGGNRTLILKSRFGDMGGAIGAACFARMQDL